MREEMGLRLPIYPYYAAQGRREKKSNPKSTFNRRAYEEMKRFADYLSEPAILRIAFNIIPPLGTQTIPTTRWFEPAVFDEDDDDHRELSALMTRVGRHGTILVPNLTHIVGKKEKLPPSRATRKLMMRFDEEDIEILPLVLKLKDTSYDLTVFPKSFQRTNVPAPELFELMPEMARLTVRYLNHSAISGRGEAQGAGRQQLTPSRPNV
jgi:hypothetical protein